MLEGGRGAIGSASGKNDCIIVASRKEDRRLQPRSERGEIVDLVGRMDGVVLGRG